MTQMADVDGNWLQQFDEALRIHLAIAREPAGITDDVVRRYADLSPRDAALQYGEDYDLSRIEHDWLS